jgi:hypothetical protein
LRALRVPLSKWWHLCFPYESVLPACALTRRHFAKGLPVGILRTEGFSRILEITAQKASAMDCAYSAAHHVATIGGTLKPEVGLAALSGAETRRLEALRTVDARLVTAPLPEGTEVLIMTDTGRLQILPPAEDPTDGGRVVGYVDWSGRRPAGLDTDCGLQDERDHAEMRACRQWLESAGDDAAQTQLGNLRYILRHVGPMRVHVGASCYTNLGRDANLVGKSVSADSAACTLNALAARPVGEWADEDACFVVCMTALIASGTPSRTEEFSGTQLLPHRLEVFLRDRLAAYDVKVSADVDTLSLADRLQALAEQSRTARAEALRHGASPYRTVQSMPINKQEHFFERDVTTADLPARFTRVLRGLLPGDVDTLEPSWSALLPELDRGSGHEFSTRYEQTIHDLVEAATEGTGSHVGMSRGPKDIVALDRFVAAGSSAPGHWKTSDYFCCVVPSGGFVARFADVPHELVQVVRAIAARMRWNGWHFMPHAAGVHEHHDFRERDWFFAPSMPDMTEWTSYHHQGHVANGVRHAIRVPLPATLGAALRPGVYDLRLMRTDGEVYEVADLRAAVAMGRVLRSLYQSRASWLLRHGRAHQVTDFGNDWYNRRYGAGTPHRSDDHPERARCEARS